MKTFYHNVGLEMICGLLGKSRQAYYDHRWRSEHQSVNEGLLVELISSQRRLTPGVGARKLMYLLQEEMHKHHLYVGRDQFFEVMRRHDLLLRRRKKYIPTTQSKHWLKKYPNLAAEMQLERAEQLWVSDITYVSTKAGYCYLVLITDAYSRKIVAHQLSTTLHASFCVQALQKALSTRQFLEKALMHHSDRGLQYCSAVYTTLLQQHGIQISMTQNGDPYENALAERVNGILKQEWKLDQTFLSFEHAEKIVNQAIYQYNHYRPHASCDYLTPIQAHQKTGTLKKRWKPYVKEQNQTPKTT